MEVGVLHLGVGDAASLLPMAMISLPLRVKMNHNYEVTVITGDSDQANTYNNVFITLVDTDGRKSEQTWLRSKHGMSAFSIGAVSTFTVSSPAPLGKLIMIEVNKQPNPPFPEVSWFLSQVKVKSPTGDTYNFPVYRWIADSKVHQFREARALKASEDTTVTGMDWRKKDLTQRKEDYSWRVFIDGIAHCVKADSIWDLPWEIRSTFTRGMEMGFTLKAGMLELKLKGLDDCQENWTNIENINNVFSFRHTELSDYVHKHWKDNHFFGYQFLNGINPMMIQRCEVLPENFPVTDSMVFPKLKDEMKKGNMFLCDYKLLDGVKTNTINNTQQYLAAPLVLLHRTPDDKLMPIAIQLKQKAGENNPIFLQTDSKYDWLTAKIFVKGAEFNMHQLNFHLLRTHLLAEVFAVSLLRNLHMVHPLYKLLFPHIHFTLQINFLARNLLVSKDGVFTKFTASGGEGMITILKRAQSSMTYSSLCIPDDITERGLDSLPNFYYRDDGLKLWDIIHRFVQGLLGHYYEDDAAVQDDSELQSWIQEIFKHGFLSKDDAGFPSSFCTVAEMVKFVTMVIFTCSCQHSAVNSGQFDYGGWMPNAPRSLQQRPPTRKGTTSKATMLQTFPNISTTVHGMAAAWLLSRQYSDFIPLGHYSEEHFTEEIPHKWICGFQEDLKSLSKDIKERNKKLTIPYTYLDPEKVENSVAL
ncbi:polyunsaturated fatty acid lipoxygenase ALOX15B-like [Scomber japonicus]|uniref:polyunsaturated fatty acid lipoxygenase ALOX15B-like n=1 Tax=Scomber japonicus TaxID=13676 RepID=UPI0023069D8E|nr:polyunsaturated fatty acid lipoxygenase ALOX15B-like [Scomber japonicus]